MLGRTAGWDTKGETTVASVKLRHIPSLPPPPPGLPFLPQGLGKRHSPWLASLPHAMHSSPVHGAGDKEGVETRHETSFSHSHSPES